jgi:hypothetical protein
MAVVIDGTLGIDTIQANTVTSAKIVDGTIVGADLSGGTGSGALTQYTSVVTPLLGGGSLYTATHTLGVVPAEVELELTCITAERGYVTGDVIVIRQSWNGSVTTAWTMWKNSTSVGAWLSTGFGLLINNKNTDGSGTPTAANWSYRFKLRAA